MPIDYRNIIARGALKEAEGLVEEITHRIQYVEGMSKYVGNGGAVDRNMDEISTRLDHLYWTQQSLSKFVKSVETLIWETQFPPEKEDN